MPFWLTSQKQFGFDCAVSLFVVSVVIFISVVFSPLLVIALQMLYVVAVSMSIGVVVLSHAAPLAQSGKTFDL